MNSSVAKYFAVSLLAVAGSVAAYFWLAQGQDPPSRGAMRQYVISRLSDSDIRAANERAQLEVEQWTHDRKVAEEQQKLKAEADEREEAARRTQCADVVYRERHPDDCATSSGGGYAGTLSLGRGGFFYHGKFITQLTFEDALEVQLLGVCAEVRTVREAKAKHCLPND